MARQPVPFDINSSNSVMGGAAASSALWGSPRGIDVSGPLNYNMGVPRVEYQAPRTPVGLVPPSNPVAAPSPAPEGNQPIGYNPDTDMLWVAGHEIPANHGTMLEAYAQKGAFSGKVDASNIPPNLMRIDPQQVLDRITTMKQGRSFGDSAKEVGRNLVEGATSHLPAMINEAGSFGARALGADGIADKLQQGADYWNDNSRPADILGRGEVAKTLVAGVENLAPSIVAMGATIAAPEIGLPMAAALFGGAQGGETYDKSIKAGVAPDDAFGAALKTAAIEALGEIPAEYLGAKFIMGAKGVLTSAVHGGKVTAEQAVKMAVDPKWVKGFAASWAENAAVQSGTEFGQGYFENEVERGVGASKESSADVGASGARAALGMSALLGPLGAIGSYSAAGQRERLGAALSDFTQPVDALKAGAAIARGITPDVGFDSAHEWFNSHAGNVAKGFATHEFNQSPIGTVRDMFSEAFTTPNIEVPEQELFTPAVLAKPKGALPQPSPEQAQGDLFPAPVKGVAAAPAVELTPAQQLLNEAGVKPTNAKVKATEAYLELVDAGAIDREYADDQFFALLDAGKYGAIKKMFEALQTAQAPLTTGEDNGATQAMQQLEPATGGEVAPLGIEGAITNRQKEYWTARNELGAVDDTGDSDNAISAKMGISRQRVSQLRKETLSRVLKHIQKSFGVDEAQARDMLRKRAQAARVIEPSATESLGMSPAVQESVVDSAEIFGNDEGATSGMGIIDTVGGSQSAVGTSETPSDYNPDDVTPSDNAVAAARESEHTFYQEALNSPDMVAAAEDWDVIKNKGLPVFAKISNADKAEWIIFYTENKLDEDALYDYMHRIMGPDLEILENEQPTIQQSETSATKAISDNASGAIRDRQSGPKTSVSDTEAAGAQSRPVRQGTPEPEVASELADLIKSQKDDQAEFNPRAVEPAIEVKEVQRDAERVVARKKKTTVVGKKAEAAVAEETTPEVALLKDLLIVAKGKDKAHAEIATDYIKRAMHEDVQKEATDWLDAIKEDEVGAISASRSLFSRGSSAKTVEIKDGDYDAVRINLSTHKELVKIILSMEASGYGKFLERVDGFYILPPEAPVDAAASGSKRTGLYSIYINADMLDGLRDRDEFVNFKRTILHEVVHVADDVSGGDGFFSSDAMLSTSGEVFEEISRKFVKDSWVKNAFDYPINKDWGFKGAELQKELFAQIMSAYLHPELRKKMLSHTPQTYMYAKEIHNVIIRAEAARTGKSTSGKTGTAGQTYTVRKAGDGQVHTGGKSPGTEKINSASQSKLDTSVQAVADTAPLMGELIKRKLTGFAMGGMFGHDFAKFASSELSAVTDYFKAVSARMVERARQEERIDEILRSIDDEFNDTQKKQINTFLISSQYEFGGKYFEQPAWIREKVRVDEAFKSAFDELSPEQRSAARDIFEEGDRQWSATQDAIQEALPAGEKLAKAKLEGMYVSLKRVGDYTVVAKSNEFIKNEALAAQGDNDASKWLTENKTDDAHYYVSFHDSEWEALKERQEIMAQNPDMQVRAAQAEFQPDGLGEMQFQTYKRIEEMVESTSMGNKAKKEALKKVVQQLYIQSLNQQHALKTRMRRQRIKGANKDALRVFALQGRANAALIASLRTTGPLQEAVQKARGQARTAEQKAIVNELLKRHAAMTQYKATPYQDKLTAYSSVHFLLTSPAYFLQNMTQPFMYSMPVVAGDHGYAKSWSAFMSAWGSTFSLVKFFSKDALDLNKVGALKDNVGMEQDAMKLLLDRNLLDIGLNADLSDFADKSILPRPMRKAIRALRGIATNIETLNRLSTALAAYRLEYASALNAGKTAQQAHEQATEYAGSVIVNTHGDYSGYNAPRYLMQGNSAMPVKVMGQFRKFQLIQIALLTKLTKQAFAGATVEERAAARASLTFLLGQLALITGGFGIPLVSFLAGAGLDDGDDKEARLRRIIGNRDLATVLLHGLPAELGLDVSNRLGMENTFNPAAFVNSGRTPQDTLKNYAAAFVGGPSLSVAMQMMAGYSDITDKGQYQKGLEKMLPTGLANLSKAMRYQTDGFTTSNGDVVMKPEEISTLSSILQGAGLPTSVITDRQWRNEAAYNANSEFMSTSAELTAKYAKAAKDGDIKEKQSIREQWVELQTRRKEAGLMKQPLSTLLKAPMQQHVRERKVSGGVEFTKQNRKFVNSLEEL